MVKIINPENQLPMELMGDKLTDSAGNSFELINGAFRLVKERNYSDNFGFQWNLFQEVQIDDLSGNTITSERFFKATGWSDQLEGQVVLEAGCGAGRFTSVVLKETGADVYSFDYSNSVEANFKNNGPHQNLKLFQASIYDMPFEENSFDKVFCFGVLQFTPDPKKAVERLTRMLKPGGQLVVDFFPKKGWWTKVHAKYILRPFTSRMDHEKLLALIESNIDCLMVIYRFFSKLGLNKVVNRFLPICDIDNTLPKDLPKEQMKKWAILDTFNMLSPVYDNPLRMNDVQKWFTTFGLSDVQGEVVRYAGNNNVHVVRGTNHTNK